MDKQVIYWNSISVFDWNIGGNLQVISTYFTTRYYWADQELQGRPTSRGRTMSCQQEKRLVWQVAKTADV